MLKDKVIVITGASRGIGEAIARAAVAEGAKVVLASRKQADLDKVAAELGGAAIDKTFEVNVRGYLYVARAFVKHARTRGGGGSIVNIASVAGIRAAPMQGIYGATKAAVISMTQTLAFELGGSKIRVNAIAPGLVETKFASALINNPMIRDQVVNRTPLGRHAQPVELAGAATYLLSDASSFTTGSVIVVDGGMTSA